MAGGASGAFASWQALTATASNDVITSATALGWARHFSLCISILLSQRESPRTALNGDLASETGAAELGPCTTKRKTVRHIPPLGPDTAMSDDRGSDGAPSEKRLFTAYKAMT